MAPPDVDRVDRARRRARPARCGAEPDAARSTATARCGSSAGQTDARLLVTPSEWQGFDYGAMAARSRPTQPRRCGRWCATSRSPRATRRRCPPLAAALTDPAAAPVRWIFYTSGTTADPKGARHTDPSVPPASVDALTDGLEITDADRVRAGVPVHAHRRPGLDCSRACSRARARVHRGVRTRDDDPDPAA